MKQQKRIYDGVISLGVNCASAMQVDVRGLRTISGPLDWLTIEVKQEEQGLKSWASMIENALQVKLKPENLKLETVTATSYLDYLGDILLVDSEQGLLFPHDFVVWPASKRDVEQAQARYRRRSARIVEALSKGGHWLFVFNSGTQAYTIDDVLHFATTLRKNFPFAQIDIFAVLFGSAKDVNGEEVAPGIFVTSTHRKFKDRADFGGRNRTWCWLDTVQVADAEYAHQGRLARIQSNDRRVLTQISRWLTVDKKTLKVYYKTCKQAYRRGYCRFREESWLKCRLPMWLWLKTRKRCFLKLVVFLMKL